MSAEIRQLNDWLENQALAWEKTINDNIALKGSAWPEYFRGLKDLDKKDFFCVSSATCICKNPITEYLTNHKTEYNFAGYTGGCLVTKKYLNTN